MSQVKKLHDVERVKVDGSRIIAYVSVWNNVDKQGDRVVAGAFKNSLKRWRAKGDPIPFVWGHRWEDPMAFLGGIDPRDVSEDERGLRVLATIDDPTPFAQQVIRLLKSRRVTQFSFSYDIVKERRGKDGANELVELSLIECGPCLVAANDETELISAKQLMESAANNWWEDFSVTGSKAEYLAERRASVPLSADPRDPKAVLRQLDELTKHNIGGPRPWPDSDTVSAVADVENVRAHLVAQHERFPEELTGLADVRLQNMHRVIHGRLGDAVGHTHPALRELEDVLRSPVLDPKSLLRQLDKLDIKRTQPAKKANVDAFVTRVHQQMVEEAVETSRDAAWRETTNELATHVRDVPNTMTEVTEGAVGTDKPEAVQQITDITEDEVYEHIQIVQVTPDE